MISGGGTGGHIYPAIAIADAVKAIDKDAEILFVGAQGKMEMEKIPKAGYHIEGLWISGLQRRLTAKNLLFPVKVVHSSLKALQIINQFKPDIAVGVGGYASGPLLRMAEMKGIPTLLQEQNGYAGLTNKLLAKKANKICVAYPNMENYFPKDKIVFTGNPVRTDIMELESIKTEALAHYGFTPDKPILFVFGGSLGARTFNECMLDGVKSLTEEGIQVIWQTGKNNYGAIKSKMEGKENSNLVLLPFIEKMQLAYACADLVIARAGALSISELCLAQKATILVPSPNVAEDHQTKNAKALVSESATVLITDKEAKEKLVNTAIELLKDEEKRNTLQENIKKLAKPNAAKDIAHEVFRLSKIEVTESTSI